MTRMAFFLWLAISIPMAGAAAQHVTLFQDHSSLGDKTIERMTITPPNAWGGIADLSGTVVGSDEVTSVYVDAGYRVYLWDWENYSGPRFEATGFVKNVTDFNDRAASVSWMRIPPRHATRLPVTPSEAMAAGRGPAFDRLRAAISQVMPWVDPNTVLGDAYGVSEAPTPWLTLFGSDWMADIPDTTLISRISIPGTHDSAALYGGAACQTQTWSIEEQLEAGIRYLDIRLSSGREMIDEVQKDVLWLYHGSCYQNQRFDQVLDTVTRFLEAQPTEFVLMRVKREGKEVSGYISYTSNLTAHLTDTRYEPYIAPYAPDNGMPAIGAKLGPATAPGTVRGKIFVMAQNYGGAAANVSLGWGNEQYMKIENHYKIWWFAHWEEYSSESATLPSKKEFVRQMLWQAESARTNQLEFFINQLAGSTGMIPSDVARAVNRDAYDFIGSYRGPKVLGVVAMDFPGDVMIWRVIRSNF